jgi:hypothetical protein
LATLVCVNTPQIALAASFTPKSSIAGYGIDFGINVIAGLFTTSLQSALGNPSITKDTALSGVDFTNANVFTAFFEAVDAAGSKDVFSAKSSSNTAGVAHKIIDAVGKYPETTAKIGGKIDRRTDTIEVGIPLTLTVKNSFGAYVVDKTYSSGYGFAFANGKSYSKGEEKVCLIRADKKPESVPAPLAILGPIFAFRSYRKLKNYSEVFKA